MRAELADRKRALAAKRGDADPPAGVTEKDIQIPSREAGRSITCRVYAPTSETAPKEGSPLIFFFHGGGFCLGTLENEEWLCRTFTKELGFVTLNLDYRLAPENKFPAASDDAWDAVKWVRTSKYGTDNTEARLLMVLTGGGACIRAQSQPEPRIHSRGRLGRRQSHRSLGAPGE